MALTSNELRSAIEAVLFAASEPVAVDDLVALFPEEGKDAVAEQLDDIRKFYDGSGRGFTVEIAAGGFRFATRPENDPFLRRFFSKQKEGRLSVAALETLAIVAYRQPITAPEISEIRGVNSSGVIRTLLERRMVRISGRKNVVGSPFLYRTTRDFLTHFGLSSIQELPRLEEFADILGENIGEELLGTGLDEYAASLEAQAAAESDADTPEATETPGDAIASAAAHDSPATEPAGADVTGEHAIDDDPAAPGVESDETREESLSDSEPAGDENTSAGTGDADVISSDADGDRG